MESLRAGDPAAFEKLVRHYGPRLLAVTRRIVRDEEDARDCVQDAFLAVHRKLADFEGRASFGSWLHRIATNAALMRLRARRARPEDPVDPGAPEYDRFGFRIGPTRESERTPEELLDRAGTHRRVRAAIDALPESYRTVLLLRDIEGFSTREAAEALGASEAAIKVRLHRARNALKALLEPLFEEEEG